MKFPPAQGGDRGRHSVPRFHRIVEEHRGGRGHLEPSRIELEVAIAVALDPDLLDGAELRAVPLTVARWPGADSMV
jgi:hypothetical protein